MDFYREKSIDEVNSMHPLNWAYIGDGVYELYIRMYLINKSNLKPNKLHTEAIKYVSAEAQCVALKRIENELTEDEKDIVRKGRNAENHHTPKNVGPITYSYSTGFEALIGYLYLTKNDERLKDILKLCIDE